MILKINARSRAGDVSAVATSILNDFTNRDFPADPFMKSQIRKLTGNNKLMTEALNEKAAHSILAPIDEKRDDMLRVIFHEVNAKELWPDAAISKPAMVVADELDKYGFETIDMAYATESANINALLQDLKKPDVEEAITSLPGLGNLIKKLKALQQEFETAYLRFVGQKIEKEKLLSASKLRVVIRTQINNEIVVYLNAMALSMPDQYKDSAEVIKMVIDNNNIKVRNRLKKPGEEESTL